LCEKNLNAIPLYALYNAVSASHASALLSCDQGNAGARQAGSQWRGVTVDKAGVQVMQEPWR